VNGRAVRERLRLTKLPLSDLCDVLISYAVDDETVRSTVQTAEDRVEPLTRRRAREALLGAAGRSSPTAEPVPPGVADADPDTWGLLPEHQAGMRAALLMAGPPAGPQAAP
jgi:hypothetical protein